MSLSFPPHHDPSAARRLTRVSAHDVFAWIRQARAAQGEELALIDVREEGEFGLGHPLWATHVPYSQLELLVRALVPNPACRVVLLDQGAGMAEPAARRLQVMGYHHLHVLDGGIPAWTAAGGELFKGVFVPGKVFGEWIEHAFATPGIDAPTLQRWRDEGRDVIVIDPRTTAEYAVRHVPDAVSCPGSELLRRFADLVPHAQTTVVAACGGRTRGLVAAQTLIEAGVPNPVYALIDGLHGWQLAGYAPQAGSATEGFASTGVGADAARYAQRLQARAGTSTVSRHELDRWLADTSRTTYLLDVRGPDEFAAGHLPGSRSAPGVQLLQALDRWVGTLGARLVLVDDDGVRARQVAFWLTAMGWPVWVLEDAWGGQAAAAVRPGTGTRVLGNAADLAASVPLQREAPAMLADQILPAEAARRLAAGASAWCFDTSALYAQGHPAGSRWANRSDLARVLAEAADDTSLVLFSADGDAAHLAAVDLTEAGARVAVVAGGWRAWAQAGLPMTEPGEDPVPDAQRIDFLFWAHARRAGNQDHMRQYLSWERGLLEQLQRDGSSFRIPGQRPTAGAHHGGAQ